jgi:hypothetical protein
MKTVSPVFICDFLLFSFLFWRVWVDKLLFCFLIEFHSPSWLHILFDENEWPLTWHLFIACVASFSLFRHWVLCVAPIQRKVPCSFCMFLSANPFSLTWWIEQVVLLMFCFLKCSFHWRDVYTDPSSPVTIRVLKVFVDHQVLDKSDYLLSHWMFQLWCAKQFTWEFASDDYDIYLMIVFSNRPHISTCRMSPGFVASSMIPQSRSCLPLFGFFFMQIWHLPHISLAILFVIFIPKCFWAIIFMFRIPRKANNLLSWILL